MIVPDDIASRKAAAESTPHAVSLRHVRKTFPANTEAISDLSLDVPVGQFLAILGPSGCGKSTLLRIIAGLEKPTAGTVAIARPATTTGQNRISEVRASPHASPIACVFQDAHLLPWRTVTANVALPLELMGVPEEQRTAAAREAIESVGLADAAARYPAQLSGGMRMRVSLARALITDPRLLLLDEPFAALDEITRQRLDEQLYELWVRRRMTVIFVTHSIPESTFLAQRAIVLSRRPARIVEDRTIDLPEGRTESLRGNPVFAIQTQWLYAALHEGERL